MKRYSTKHFKRILIANNVNIDIDLKTGIVAKNMAKKEKIKQVISMGGIMWEGLNSSLIKVDEALLKQQI
ncbi:hypothetical protein ISN44_As01g031740, partial [Arabidopsis suecica]